MCHPHAKVGLCESNPVVSTLLGGLAVKEKLRPVSYSTSAAKLLLEGGLLVAIKKQGCHPAWCIVGGSFIAELRDLRAVRACL